METFKRLGLLINLLLFSFNLVSCGGGGGNSSGGGGSPSTSVPLAPTGVSVAPGTGQATVSWNTVTGATSYNFYMASVSGVNKTNYGSLADGMKHTGVPDPFTPMGLTNGTTYYFVVTAVNSAGESPESQEVSVVPSGAAISIVPSLVALLINATQSFTAMANGFPTSAVTWSVQESNGGSITSSGVYTAPAAAGTYHVVATNQTDSSKKAVATIIVSVPVVSVTVTPVLSAVTLGGNSTFSATVTNTPNMAVTWSVQETNGGTIDSNGIYSAPNVPGGTYHVIATSQADTTKTAFATVNIYSLTKSLNDATAVAISPNYKNDQTVYAAGGAGIYLSTDGGTTWKTINTAIQRITTLAISPNFTADNTLFVSGCSGTYSTYYPCGTAGGVLKSTDGGTTWNNVLAYFQDARDIGLFYDSSNNLIVFVMLGGAYPGGSVKIVRSGDGGATWSTVLSFYDSSGRIHYTADSLVISSVFTYKTIFVAIGSPDLGSSIAGVSWIDASYDGGITWEQISFYDNVPNGFRDQNGHTGLCITYSGVTLGVGVSQTFDGSSITMVPGATSATLYITPNQCASSAGKAYQLTTYRLPDSSGAVWYPAVLQAAVLAGYYGGNYGTLFSGYSISQDYGRSWESLSKSVSIGNWADSVRFSPDYSSDGVIFAVGGPLQPGLWKYTNLK